MTKIDEVEYKRRVSAFEKEQKKLEPYHNDRRPLTSIESLLKGYKENFTGAYNDLTNYIRQFMLATLPMTS